jgi:hypothetical protein
LNSSFHNQLNETYRFADDDKKSGELAFIGSALLDEESPLQDCVNVELFFAGGHENEHKTGDSGAVQLEVELGIVRRSALELRQLAVTSHSFYHHPLKVVEN